MNAWKISGSIVLLLYTVTSVFIYIRKVDGAGVVQTPEMRNITLIIWRVFGLIILIGYLIWLTVFKISRNAYMEALKQAQIEDNYESFIELVADYEQDELDKRIDLLTRIEKERKFAQSQTRLDKFDK